MKIIVISRKKTLIKTSISVTLEKELLFLLVRRMGIQLKNYVDLLQYFLMLAPLTGFFSPPPKPKK